MLVNFPRATRYPIKDANPYLTPCVVLGRRLTSPAGVLHHALPEVLACPLHDFATSLYQSAHGGCSSFLGFPARSRPKKKISRLSLKSAHGGCSSFLGFPARSRPKKKISRLSLKGATGRASLSSLRPLKLTRSAPPTAVPCEHSQQRSAYCALLFWSTIPRCIVCFCSPETTAFSFVFSFIK